jgi:hypothetical protein
MSKSQRELKAVRQAQREEAQRRQRARERRNLLLIVGGLAAAGLAILVVAVYLNNAGQKTNRLTWQAQAGTAGEEMPDEGRNHIPTTQAVEYKNYPPTSGPHFSAPDGPADWGTIAALREGTFIHNLEHGGIVILYNCASGNECDKLKDDLTNYVQNRAPQEPTYHEVKLVMSPYSRGMKKKVALLAWRWIEFLDGYDEKEITRFYEIHVDKGPEPVP